MSASSRPVPVDTRFQGLLAYIEHDPQPMMVVAPDYRVLAANLAYRQHFGEHREVPIGKPCYYVSHHYEVPCDQAGEHCPMRRARESGLPDRVLHIHSTPSGPEHVDVELRPLLDEGGRLMAYVERFTLVRGAGAQALAEQLAGRSEPFQRALEAVRRVAPTGFPVLLLGESGTGKERFAQLVHQLSPQSGGRLVVLDCAGIPDNLFESELFGHEKGAFTGASQRKPGLVEAARGGTLFLDEVGDVPPEMQVKLLRLLESQSYRRVGGTETLHADFRLVAATHQPLQQLVAERRFREDLFHRLNVFPIRLPPLRERPGDIPLIAASLLRRIGAGDLALSSDAEQVLKEQAFPGNVRELRNLLARASLFADRGLIDAAVLGQVLDPPQAIGPAEARWLAKAFLRPAPPAVDELRRLALSFHGTRHELARQLGMSERTLYRRLAESAA